MDDFTYAPVGATREGRRPPGFDAFAVRTRVGSGPEAYRAATEAVLTFRMHRAVGVTVHADGPRAADGVRLVVGLGRRPLRILAPCRVVWAERGERRGGFGYGTLAGHPETGEEAFVVEWADDGAVWLTVSAYSRPAARWVATMGPLLGVFQRTYARRCGRVLRRLTAVG